MLNPVNHPADCLTKLQKALSALAIVKYNGAINKEEYYRSSTSTGLMLAYNTNLANIAVNSLHFVLGLNTEIVLLSGTNINSAPSFLRCQIDTAISTNQHTFYFFALHDIILEVDINSKTIVAKF